MTIGINVSGAEYSWMPFASSADLDYLKSQGITMIRLPISWERMQPALNGPLDQTYLTGLKNFLSDAAGHGIEVVVDVHNYGRYNLNYAKDAAANYGITAPNTADASVIGSAAVPISSFANFWGQLAGALNGQAGIAGYDLMNEPYALPTPTTWANAAQAAVNAIRIADTHTPIYVEGYQWAGALNWVQNNGNLHIADPSNKIVYEAHLYFDTWSSGQYAQTYDQQGATPDIGVKAIQPFLDWLQQNNYQGFVGEFGVPYNDPKWLPVLSNFMTKLEAAGVSGTMWTYAYSDPSGKNSWWPNSNTIDPMNIKNLPGVDQPQMEVLFAHTAPAISGLSDVTGSVSGGLTNSNHLTLSGVGASDSKIQVFDGASLVGTTTTDAKGAWVFSTGSLANGGHSFTAKDVDAAGTVSEASTALAVTVTGTGAVPAAPTIATFSTDSGVAGDHITNDNTLTLSGTAEAGSTVKVYDGATLLGSAVASGSGAWSYTSAALPNGGHSLTATATDAAGNTGVASTALSVTIDTTAPIAPVIALFSTDSGLAGDHVTNDNTLTLTGTAEAGSTVKVYDGATLLGSAIASGTGAWSYTSVALPNGGHSLTATATDAAGNTGVASAALAVTIDTTAPIAPVIAIFSSDSGVAGDHITNDDTLTLSGTAETGSTVKVYDGATLLGSAIASGTGAWSYTSAALANGGHSLTATATDAAGNTGLVSAALAVTIDTTAPIAPVIATFSTDSGVAGDHITNDDTLTLTGTAEAGSTVKVYDGATLLGSAIASGTGAWSYTSAALANGGHSLTATATDAAGNTGLVSAALAVTIDTKAPIAPVIATFSTDSGVAGDHITNDATLTLTGSAEAGSTVKVYDGATLLGTTAASGTGAWSYTSGALTDGGHSLSATATDVAGNVSALGNLGVTVDTVAPNAPVITGDATVNTNQVLLTGTAEAGSTVTVFEGTSALGTALTGANGAWSYTTGALTAGAHGFTAKATDVAGNTGVLSAVMDPVIGGTVIESVGATSLDQIGTHFYLDNSAGVGPSLKYNRVDVATGQYGAWTPLGVEQTATGYEVAWKNDSADQYIVWNTDKNGNWMSQGAIVSGANSIVTSAEAALHQDLNGDGTIGVPSLAILPTTVIESVGATSVDKIGTHFYLYDSTGTGQSLKSGGFDVWAGQWGAWTPIGAEQTATGYEVAWKNGSTNQYIVWNTDSNGNWMSQGAIVSGTSSVVTSAETSLHQDLNGDGTIGVPSLASLPATVIESVGATSLDKIGTHIYLYDNTDSGPSLKTGAADFTVGQFGAWTPIGVEQTTTGYEVAWKNGSANQYIVWNTDSSGNWVSQGAIVSGSSPVVKSAETDLHQDLNGDGVIGAAAGAAPATIVSGTAGNDMLTSSAANEVFYGNGGSNTFVFAGNTGRDTIADFHVSNDVIQLSHNAFASFAEVLAHTAQVGADVTVTIDASNAVTLSNTTVADLNSHNFHLV